jgi:hypothetical protein
VGLLQWAVGAQDLAPVNAREALANPFEGLFRRLGSWFKVLLPDEGR